MWLCRQFHCALLFPAALSGCTHSSHAWPVGLLTHQTKRTCCSWYARGSSLEILRSLLCTWLFSLDPSFAVVHVALLSRSFIRCCARGSSLEILHSLLCMWLFSRDPSFTVVHVAFLSRSFVRCCARGSSLEILCSLLCTWPGCYARDLVFVHVRLF